jgi:hypothetical protein
MMFGRNDSCVQGRAKANGPMRSVFIPAFLIG